MATAGAVFSGDHCRNVVAVDADILKLGSLIALS
jgi:hypothetical protein